MFKLEKVMDDFSTSAPEPRGPPNPNVEYIAFDEMKERILKIVTGFNGTPFTIQRLCELLTDPRRNYTGTDKFLRGVEKNVMVVSCIYPSSEKNNSNSMNRMNGVMFPSNSSGYTERSINGPGTPRPVSRPKLSLSSLMTTNGLPDGTENKDSDLEQTDEKAHSDSPSSNEGSPPSTAKNKHAEEDPVEAEEHEVKRLKFDTEEEEEEEEEAQSASPQASSCEASTEMAEEAEAVSTSVDKGKESCDAENSACEESLMTSSDCTAEEDDKDTAESVTVNEETPEESHQMESESEVEKGLHPEESESTTATTSTDTDCKEAGYLGSFGSKSPEIPPESPMENSDEATEAAEEPMEQD
ncbi:serine/threonine-protein phosphatase 4 regulatory subunit 2 [Ascaphus truei]|uniref:serine/threonine-protein phosphatase 4 regulatory subunit 2 n=1 Tax=Ascaphus truei TaxID=8439 RepID=UPI003F59B63F